MVSCQLYKRGEKHLTQLPFMGTVTPGTLPQILPLLFSPASPAFCALGKKAARWPHQPSPKSGKGPWREHRTAQSHHHQQIEHCAKCKAEPHAVPQADQLRMVQEKTNTGPKNRSQLKGEKVGQQRQGARCWCVSVPIHGIELHRLTTRSRRGHGTEEKPRNGVEKAGGVRRRRAKQSQTSLNVFGFTAEKEHHAGRAHSQPGPFRLTQRGP